MLDALAQRLPPGARLYRWQEQDPANPYGALRREADQLGCHQRFPAHAHGIERDGAPLGIYPLPKTVDWRERLNAWWAPFRAWRLCALRRWLGVGCRRCGTSMLLRRR